MNKQSIVMLAGLGLMMCGFLGTQVMAQQPSSKPSSQAASKPAKAPASTPAKAKKDDASHIIEGEHSPETLFKTFCAGCHDSGLGGAPRTGDTAAWKNLIEIRGMETLVDNTYKGMGLMPKRGACAGCSEEEIRAVVAFMLKKASVPVPAKKK